MAVWRMSIVAGVLGFSAAAMQAQSPAVQNNPQPSADTRSATTVSSSVPAADSLFSSSFSSSSEADSALTEAKLFPPSPLPAGTIHQSSQSSNPWGTQQYKRPLYNSGGNKDGSSRWIIYGGGGITEPIGNTHSYLTDNFALQAGTGYQFSRHFSLPIEFDWAQFGMTKQNLDDQILISTTSMVRAR
ncbi:MAG: hypothetical protein ACLGQX_10230 [Acidobacteriota bacterium]